MYIHNFYGMKHFAEKQNLCCKKVSYGPLKTLLLNVSSFKSMQQQLNN